MHTHAQVLALSLPSKKISGKEFHTPLLPLYVQYLVHGTVNSHSLHLGACSTVAFWQHFMILKYNSEINVDQVLIMFHSL